jgi:hypothetical protein
MGWLLCIAMAVGLPLLGFLTDLAVFNTRRTFFAAEAALRRAREP